MTKAVRLLLLSALLGAAGCGRQQQGADENHMVERPAAQSSAAGDKSARPAEEPVPQAKGGSTEPAEATPAAGACDVQDGKALPRLRLRAVGTEPVWEARVEGRCVTYSHPDDQQGKRVWTKFSGSASAGRWAGALGGQPFVLQTSAEAGCSDGMSDRRYPIAVALTVGGEQRRGCAEPL